ncbi:MAG: hypothetical protein C0476_08740 [Sphingomonas sp.]|nr:hypothetical protein [Sphingomonas sp.]
MVSDTPHEMNEIEEAAHAAKRVAAAADETAAETKGNWPVSAIAIGVGVGSAALAAALLYATSTRKPK